MRRDRARLLPPLLTALLVGSIYVACSPSQPFGGDAAEMQTVPYILGIAHPTGFPLFVLLGYLWSHAIAIGSVAWRMNALCALFVGASVGVGVACAQRLRIRWWIAVPAYLWFASTSAAWTHATHADVHDLLLLLETLCVYATIVWLQERTTAALYGMALAWGLALANHPNAIWLAPGLAVAVLLARRSVTVRNLVRAAALFVAALCLYLYLPLRSWWIDAHGIDPSARLTGIHGGAFWNTNDPATLRGFLTELSGSSFNTSNHLLTILDPVHWQSYLWELFSLLHAQYGSYAILAAIVGLAAWYARDRRTAIVVALLCIAAIPFSVSYRDVESDVERYRLLAVWWLPLLVAAAAGFGDDWRADLRRIAVALFCVASLGGTFAANRIALLNNRNADGERHLIAAIARVVPTQSIVVTTWLDATPYAYGAYVDGSFAGHTIVPAWPSNQAAHFQAWSRIEPVYIVVPADIVLTDGQYARISTIDRYHVVYRYAGPPRLGTAARP